MNANRARSWIVQLESQLGQGVELVLAVTDEVVGSAQAAIGFGDRATTSQRCRPGSHVGAVTRQPSGSQE